MQVLEGVRVLSLAVNLPGPLAVARLRGMGAAVRKVEPPAGDPLAHGRPDWYRLLHEGIEVESIDLKDSAGRGRLDPRLAEADLLVTASRPASLARLGLGWDDLHARFPRLSSVAIVGYAPPADDLPGHDLLYQAEHGLVRPPEMPRTCLADLGGALEAVIAALQLVLARRAGGPGRLATVTLSGAASWFAEPLRRGLTVSGGLLGGGFAGYRCYRARDGWVAVGALEPQFQRALAGEAGTAGLDADALEKMFLTRTADEWVARARERDLPLVKVPD